MKKRITLICGGVVLLLLIVIGIYLFSEPQSPDVPDYEELSEIQMNAVKSEAERYGEDFVTTLLAGIREAQPVRRLQARNIKNEEDYYVIALIDKSGNRTCLHFFEYDGEVYMSVNHKDVYTDVGFMTTAIAGWTPTGWGWPSVSMVGMLADFGPSEASIRCAMETDYDVRSWLYNYVSSHVLQGTPEEEAIESGAQYILSQYQLYQYALENDHGIAEDVYEQMIEEELEAVREREDYEEVNAPYEAAGTTFEDYVAGSFSFVSKVTSTVDYMKYCTYKQFLEGEYTLGDTSYDNAGDYRDAYMSQVITGELDGIDVGTFAEDLEAAKQYVSNLNISENLASDQTTEEGAAVQFLTHFYTTDDNGRYTEFQGADITELEALEKATAAYYSELAPLVTEELLDKLQSNRLPYKQDGLDIEADAVCDAPKVGLVKAINGNRIYYEFTVTRTAEDVRTGEITCVKTDTGYLVDYFYEAQ